LIPVTEAPGRKPCCAPGLGYINAIRRVALRHGKGGKIGACQESADGLYRRERQSQRCRPWPHRRGGSKLRRDVVFYRDRFADFVRLSHVGASLGWERGGCPWRGVQAG